MTKKKKKFPLNIFSISSHRFVVLSFFEFLPFFSTPLLFPFPFCSLFSASSIKHHWLKCTIRQGDAVGCRLNVISSTGPHSTSGLWVLAAQRQHPARCQDWIPALADQNPDRRIFPVHLISQSRPGLGVKGQIQTVVLNNRQTTVATRRAQKGRGSDNTECFQKSWQLRSRRMQNIFL